MSSVSSSSRILARALAFSLVSVPWAAFAAVSSVGEFITFLIGPLTYLIYILFSVAILVFFWGIVVFIAHAGDERKVEEGKGFIVWGIVGIFVLVSIWGILGYIQSSLGLNAGGNLFEGPSLPTYVPNL